MGLRMLALLRFLTPPGPREPQELATVLAATPTIHRLITGLVAYYHPFNPIKPVGIGDLLVVKQFLCRYELGEVAHIENVLDGESRVRRLNRIDQTDELVSVVEDTTSLEERETSSTQRFELKSETEATIQSDLSAQLSGQVSGRYGVVEYSANAGVSYSTSSADSRRGANNFAKDVVDRSLSRIQTSVREERTTQRLTRTEELNRFELTNDSGGNLSGVYRWVDKVYRAQVYNYGKRLMFEFVIPEPAAFVLSVFEHERQLQRRPDIPQEPSRPNLDIATISAATVSTYGHIYNLSGLDPEPPAEDTIAVAIPLTGLSREGASAHERQFSVPDGYAVTSATIDGDWDGIDKNEHGMRVSIGGQTARATDTGNIVHMAFPVTTLTFVPPLIGSVNAVVFAFRIKAAGLSIALKIQRTAKHYRAWQLSVYQAIMDAWTEAHREYLDALGEYESKLQGFEISQGVTIKGRNQRINQDLIRTELRKSCLSMIALQFDAAKTDDIKFDAMRTRDEVIPVEALVTTSTQTVTQTTPEPGTTVTVTTTSTREDVTVTDSPITMSAIDVPEAVSDGRTVQFLEQAFEWQQISYVFYPYFWGKLPAKWYGSQKYYDEIDPLFARFLQAGAARVLVAVRPGFEGAVQHYLYTREPWNGGPVPDIDDPLYLAVHTELRDQQDDLNNATPYGDSWTVVVPTPLLSLQPDPALPTFDCGGGATTGAGLRSALWTGTARQDPSQSLATGQKAWVDWPSAARWQVTVPDWATEVDFSVLLSPGVVSGDVFGELRVDIGGTPTAPTTFDVNYEADQNNSAEPSTFLTGGTQQIPADLRGKEVTVKVQGRMLDPAKHPGRLNAGPKSLIFGQMNFKKP
ncbi:hypothetical protein QF037_009748 [Streptomyces canus]|uniref:hypothetical protein n=1 Tax=Streptomyces canus TaxID=58343 RepID=UPI002785CF44|nr:hypothetical protein [Streptomyces canus]MDQ0605403.1 hypothetical protein [Streptomyces canus]